MIRRPKINRIRWNNSRIRIRRDCNASGSGYKREEKLITLRYSVDQPDGQLAMLKQVRPADQRYISGLKFIYYPFSTVTVRITIPSNPKGASYRLYPFE